MSVAPTLAIEGGAPVRTGPMPPWPQPGDEEIAAATGVVRSGRLNYWVGEQGRAFEREYAESLGRRHAIAVANGTVALELALRAFGIGHGDEVVVPSRTFIATASSVVAVGATPVVADIDPESGTLTAETVNAAVTPFTRAVIPVHLGGWPAEMDPLVELARERGLRLIEDCAQAHGARYRGRPAGALGSDAATFSFCQDKIIPLGEGGMLVLDDDAAYERAWAYKDHGKSLSRLEEATRSEDGTSFKWLVDSFGTNWRLPEVSAAMGRVGLRRLPEWHAARARNALRLADGISDLPALRVPLPPDGTEHAFYRLYAFLKPGMLRPGWDRDRVARAIVAEGVPVQYGTCAEIYRERAFVDAGLTPEERLPNAAWAHDSSLAFFVHPPLGERDIDDTAAAVRKVLEVAST
jgi:dTDP-4-amino-4,6-dideoxygalactose transaminase